MTLCTLVACGSIPNGNYVGNDTFDLNAYKPILLAEANRKQLPNAIRSNLTPELQNILERSPITVLSPPSKFGFNVKFEIKVFDFVDKHEINCAPLASGLLRCYHITTLNGTVKQTIKQGVYAFGGLVSIYDAYFFNEKEVNYPVVGNIRYQANSKPALPMPGIDVVFDHTGQNDMLGKFKNIRCLKATETLAVPQALSDKGSISLIACRRHQLVVGDAYGDIVKIVEKDYNPGIYGGALYFWLEEKGIALPASLFYPNRLKGDGLLGYYDLWNGLVTGSGGHKIQNISIKWLE